MSLADLFEPTARKHLFEFWSSQLALVFAAAAAFMVEQPHVFVSLTDSIAQPWRSILVFLITAAIPILVRSMTQPKLAAKMALEREGE